MSNYWLIFIVTWLFTSSALHLVTWFIAQAKMRNKISDAWLDGCIAAHKSVSVCPFEQGTVQSIWWHRGFKHINLLGQ